MDNFSELPTKKAQEALKEVLEKDLKLEKYSTEINIGTQRGDNYDSVVYRVNIKESTPVLAPRQGLIVKTPPQHQLRREQFFGGPSFQRESLVYEKLFPLFVDFQKERGVDQETDGFHHVPKFYKCVSEELSECIILDDLKVQGFEMYDRLAEMSYDHALVAIEALAKFHALSFAVKDQCNDYPGYKKCKDVPDIWLSRMNDNALHLYQRGLSLRALSTLNREDDKVRYDNIEKVLSQPLMENLEKVVAGKLSEPNAIVCHGDFWTNNILFKKDKDGKPVEAYLVDYQFMRNASPATDLSYFFFTSTSGKFREQYMKQLLRVYYEKMSTLLRKLGSDPEQIYKEEALHADMKKFGLFGVLMAILLLPMFVAPSEECPDLDLYAETMARGEDISQIGRAQQSDSTYQIYAERMRETLIDAYKMGIIPKVVPKE